MKLRPVQPLLSGIVNTALRACDQTEYSVHGSCKFCGGTLSGYDTRLKQFATLVDPSGEHSLEVILHRSYCRSCGKIVSPEEPFYPGTRVGSPVVDLCRAFNGSMSSGRVSVLLGQMGVRVDRWSVRGYSKKPFPAFSGVTAFGLKIPVSILSLSSMAGLLDDTGKLDGDDVLAACNYPARFRINY
jgi:hypothetical protein